jgi:hypothetical protein
MGEKRTIRVVARLSEQEADLIDRRRGRIRRGAYLRIAALGNAPRQIPSINREAASNLARSLGNLATIATAMRKGHYHELETILSAVRDLGRKIQGIKLSDGDIDDAPEAPSVAIPAGEKQE